MRVASWIKAGVVGAAALALSLLLTACGTKVVVPHGAEQAVARVVSRQTGFTPTDVHCPSGVHAKAGVTFQCHFTGPHGVPYAASLKITKVQGKGVFFFITTRPTG